MRKVDIPIYPDKAKCEKIINEALTEARGGKKGRRTKLNAGEVCFDIQLRAKQTTPLANKH